MSQSLPVPWSARLAAAWGHRAPGLLIAAVLAMIGLRVAPVPTSALALPGALLVAAVLVSWLLMRAHDRRLCERCLRAMPLDPAAMASRHRRRFATVHAGGNPKLVAPYLAVLIGSNLLPGTWGTIVWATVQLSMIQLILAYTTHRTLQPWCPWCQGGGGGRHGEPAGDGPRPDRSQQLV